MDVDFQLGDVFSSFEELQRKILQYKDAKNVELHIRHSRTVNGALKRCPRKQINPVLKYNEIKYACFFSGTPYTTWNEGKRFAMKIYIILSIDVPCDRLSKYLSIAS